jgi:hypothetical protein
MSKNLVEFRKNKKKPQIPLFMSKNGLPAF